MSLWIVAAPGPSLTKEVAEACIGHNVISVNDAYRLFPYAKILYAADLAWWKERNPKFAGRKITCSFDKERNREAVANELGVTIYPAKVARDRFSLEGPIHYGRHSGFQAINIALRLSKLIVLVGFDMRGTHFFGPHKKPLRQIPNYRRWIDEMKEAARHLPKEYRIINATPDSALECFERMTLAEALNEGRDPGQKDQYSGEDRNSGLSRSADRDMGPDWSSQISAAIAG